MLYVFLPCPCFDWGLYQHRDFESRGETIFPFEFWWKEKPKQKPLVNVFSSSTDCSYSKFLKIEDVTDSSVTNSLIERRAKNYIFMSTR